MKRETESGNGHGLVGKFGMLCVGACVEGGIWE